MPRCDLLKNVIFAKQHRHLWFFVCFQTSKSRQICGFHCTSKSYNLLTQTGTRNSPVHVWKASKTKSESVARGRQTSGGCSVCCVWLVLTRWRDVLAQPTPNRLDSANFPSPLSFSALVQGDPLRIYGKALRFLKLESSGQPTVKIWWS